MRKIRKTVIMLTFSAFSSIGLVVVLICTIPIDKQTENTTTFYSGTVSEIQVINAETGTYGEIYTAEYHTHLYLESTVCKNIDVDNVGHLQKGQKIFFRIEKFKADYMDKLEFINIVSLSTEEKDIFTLDDYNNYIRQAAKPARIVSIVIATLLLLVSVFCVFSIRREIKK